jgi:hypothetical protein
MARSLIEGSGREIERVFFPGTRSTVRAIFCCGQISSGWSAGNMQIDDTTNLSCRAMRTCPAS